MKIIAGVYKSDAGTIDWLGRPLENYDLAGARRLGIRVIYQQLNAIEFLTVSENLALGQEQTRFGFLRKRHEAQDAKAALDKLGVTLDLYRPAGMLRVAERQLIEIARALRGGEARLLLMDEPTASLGDQEVDRLFRVIRALRDEGLGIVYISHKLDEVFRISDRITVLRDGRTVGTVETARTNNDELITMMVRGGLSEATGWTSNATDSVRLSVDGLATDTGLSDVSFNLYAGEVLGVYGLLGSGRTELARALFGADPIVGGTVSVDGKPVRFKSPRDGRAAGLGFVPEERAQASYPYLTVRENLTTASLENFANGPWVDAREERSATERIVHELKVRTPGIEELMLRLSGGNQQKVIVGRWLLRNSPILILDDPTSGIDVGAKEELYRLIRVLTKHGTSIFISSSELPELLAIADRIMVLHEGSLAGILPRARLDQRTVIELAVTGRLAAPHNNGGNRPAMTQ